jgi:hypothetical protein
MNKANPPKLRKLPAARQRRMDELLDKHSEGTISASERAKLKQLVAEAEQLMLANSKLLAQFMGNQPDGPPADAVPITVWVTPQPAAS